jgi:hypothetical protein
MQFQVSDLQLTSSGTEFISGGFLPQKLFQTGQSGSFHVGHTTERVSQNTRLGHHTCRLFGGRAVISQAFAWFRITYKGAKNIKMR